MHKKNKAAVVEGVIEVVKQLQLELHGSVEDSVKSKLDDVIARLEALSTQEESANWESQALELLAMCLDTVGIGLALYQIFLASNR